MQDDFENYEKKKKTGEIRNKGKYYTNQMTCSYLAKKSIPKWSSNVIKRPLSLQTP